jgi:class 3 adenylate cyclase
MISPSKVLSQWLLHVSGAARLPQVLQPLTEAVELNREGNRILSTFGRRRFDGLIGFVDMRGFSTMARGLSAEAVRDIAAPFVAAVVAAANRNHSFVDKTIGDEVMLVMPSIGQDVELADIGLCVREPWPIALSNLLADLLRLVDSHTARRAFSAGFAFGDVVLERVGDDSYSEWTVYGNAVNAAKRIQDLAARLKGNGRRSAPANCFSVGVIRSERQKWFSEEFDLRIWREIGPVVFHEAETGVENCKGVGEICYIAAEVHLRAVKADAVIDSKL